MKEELGVDSVARELLGSLENSFIQNGRRHCEINLIYRFELVGASAEALTHPTAQEPWLEFLWADIGDLAGATVSDFKNVDGSEGRFVQKLRMYGKRNCPVCGTAIAKAVLGGRTSWYCPSCQK